MTDVGGRPVEAVEAGVGMGEAVTVRDVGGCAPGMAPVRAGNAGGDVGGDVVHPTTTNTAVTTSPARRDERMRPSLPALPP